MLNVLVIDDDAAERSAMVRALQGDPGVRISGAFSSGEEAAREISRSAPDVVVMDTMMPGIDGFEATRMIMSSVPVPIILVSARLDSHTARLSSSALEAGAVAFLEKPGDEKAAGHLKKKMKLLQAVKAMAEVKVIRRWDRQRQTEKAKSCSSPEFTLMRSRPEIVAIGASVGGPPVVRSIISKLPENFPVPILVVQHILQGFSGGMVDWMNEDRRGPRICMARGGDRAAAGSVYFAPDGVQMKIMPDRTIVLTNDEPEDGFRPSVSYMFRSVARSFGDRSVGILLTGMGRDGAGGLKDMREAGAFTIVQDEESCVVFGMPGEAVKMGAVSRVMRPDKIPEILVKAAGMPSTT
jgi:two-component system chemotaxis response regulator CheB